MLTDRGRIAAGLASAGDPTPEELAEIEAEKAKIRGENAQNWANSRVKQVGTRPIGRKLLQSEKD